MNGTTMRRSSVLRALLAAVAAVAVAGCGLFGGDGQPSQSIVGTWTASESIQLFGATLRSDFEINFTESSQVQLRIDTLDGGSIVHRLSATGGYSYSAAAGTITLTFQGAQQTADVLTPGAPATTLESLSPEDLQDLAADFPAGLQCDLAENSFTLGFTGAPNLVFTRVPR